ncbi:MAG: heavy-metal-associated domain-containing protein [Nostoc sp.]|uniref:heavy-metal-associated domain-containing protein n=1 Tax=Nostoc sp. TaxID=1180 RepID=UPI002FFA3245
MVLQMKVSNIACEGCAETITESIHVMEPESKVDVDVKAKTVTVESATSEFFFKMLQPIKQKMRVK